MILIDYKYQIIRNFPYNRKMISIYIATRHLRRMQVRMRVCHQICILLHNILEDLQSILVLINLHELFYTIVIHEVIEENSSMVTPWSA